jgi:hypothetical protein
MKPQFSKKISGGENVVREDVITDDSIDEDINYDEINDYIFGNLNKIDGPIETPTAKIIGKSRLVAKTSIKRESSSDDDYMNGELSKKSMHDQPLKINDEISILWKNRCNHEKCIEMTEELCDLSFSEIKQHIDSYNKSHANRIRIIKNEIIPSMRDCNIPTHYDEERIKERTMLHDKLKKIVEDKGGKLLTTDPLEYVTAHT